MVTGIARLRAAGELLRRGGEADPAASLAAAAEVRAAADDGLDGWPWRLQVRSVPIQFRLVRHGSTEATVRRLTGPELAELRRELLGFVEEAERLDAGGGVPQATGTDGGHR